MTENVPGDTGLVREEEFETAGPIEIDVAVGAGRIEVKLSDRSGVLVTVRHDEDASDQWIPGLSGLLNWVSGQFGTPAETSPDDAVRQTRIDLTGSRLVVRTPKPLPMRGVPLVIVVEAPNGSHVESKSGSATLVTTGSAGRLNVISGTGDVSVDRADGVASVNSGSAAVRLGPMMGGVRVKSGSGDIEVSSVGGAAPCSPAPATSGWGPCSLTSWCAPAPVTSPWPTPPAAPSSSSPAAGSCGSPCGPAPPPWSTSCHTPVRPAASWMCRTRAQQGVEAHRSGPHRLRQRRRHHRGRLNSGAVSASVRGWWAPRTSAHGSGPPTEGMGGPGPPPSAPGDGRPRRR